MEHKKRVVLIGPVYPYKGGISHYTSLMYRALCSEYDVSMISYRLQYPKLLFKKEQKDYSNDCFKIDQAVYWIHTVFPWNWINTGLRIRRLKPELVIIQWWHPYFAPCYRTLSAVLHPLPILFICHNVLPHELFFGARFLTRLALGRGNAFIVQSEQDEADLKALLPEANVRRTAHPTYNVFKLRNLNMEESRRILKAGMDEKLLLFFGFVREYKGLKHLIKAMPLICSRLEKVRLMIVGDFGNDKEEYLALIRENAVEASISIYDGYIPDEEVEPFFAASNLVILPYESATQSGIVQIAFGFEKPVVVTNVGGLPEVVTNQKTGYVVERKNSRELAEAVISYFEQGKEQEFAEEIKKESYRFSWERMTEVIKSIEQEIRL